MGGVQKISHDQGAVIQVRRVFPVSQDDEYCRCSVERIGIHSHDCRVQSGQAVPHGLVCHRHYDRRLVPFSGRGIGAGFDDLFEEFFQTGFVTSIQNTISAEGTVNIQATIEKYAGFLPESIKESLTASAAGLLGSGAPDLAAKLVDEVIAPLLTPIIAIVLFFVAFALCRLLVSLLVAVLTNVNRIPLMGSVNRFFGFLMGLLAGVVDLYLVLCAVWAVIVITGGSIEFLNDQALAGSIAYSAFGRFNPFY